MSIKWMMFAVFLWLGTAMLAAIAEYVWVQDTEASLLYNLINGISITGWATGLLAAGGVVTGIAAVVLGNRALTVASVGLFIPFAIAFRSMITFDYPTLFYGPYEIVRYIMLILGIVIFIATTLAVLRGGSSS